LVFLLRNHQQSVLSLLEKNERFQNFIVKRQEILRCRSSTTWKGISPVRNISVVNAFVNGFKNVRKNKQNAADGICLFRPFQIWYLLHFSTVNKIISNC